MTVVRRIVSLLALTMLIAGPAMAQSVGTFIPAGDMSAPRSSHTATRLQNGKVLVAGEKSWLALCQWISRSRGVAPSTSP